MEKKEYEILSQKDCFLSSVDLDGKKVSLLIKHGFPGQNGIGKRNAIPDWGNGKQQKGKTRPTAGPGNWDKKMLFFSTL
jgi:hypothetical protein